MVLRTSLLSIGSNFKFCKSKTLYGWLLVIFLFFFSSASAQLQQFELQVTATDETCSGNGTLTFAITNGQPGASFSYTVYKQPDLTNPISVSSSTSLGSLNEGAYKIIATQSFGQLSNTDEVEVSIVRITAPISFSVSATNQTCTEGAKMIVTTTSGTASLFEIISGPVIVPPQESNVFEALPAGAYVIRVYDECGDADVTTFELFTSNDPPQISEPLYDNSIAGNCDSVTVTNTISYGEGIAISYPVTVEYIVTPLNGDPATTITQTYESGDAVELSLTQTFPTGDSDYTYSLKITDSCNSGFTKEGMSLTPELTLEYIANIILPCGQHYLTFTVTNFTPPFTLNFNSAPDGFDPQLFNATHPGPFTTGMQVYGSDEKEVPEGLYQVEVIDSCGNSAIVDFGILDETPEPVAGASNNGCFSEFGRITVSVPDRKIVSAIIEEAPDDYTESHVLPENVSNKINNNGLVVFTNMPVGKYIFRIVDECGIEYLVPAEILPFEVKGFSINTMSGCVVGSGALRVTSGNGKMVSLIMTDAPEEFGEDMPFDVSSYIDNGGAFFMEGLPIGDYSFSGTDICGVDGEVSATVQPNSPPGNVVTFNRKCGNYDLTVADSGAVNFYDPPTYWLQKRIDTENDIWGHPETNVTYVENTEPTVNNSILLVNNQTLVDLEYEGKFRVIKYFKSFISPANIKACLGELGTFEYEDGVRVKSVYNLSCYQNSNDIYIDATGLAPLHYTITAKDDIPFALDNGNSAIFSGLEPGVYEFVVEDACGYIGRTEVNISLLPELTNANEPGDMLICVAPDGALSAEFDLLSQNPAILKDQPKDVYTITYHTSIEDAENGVDAIPTLHTNISNPELIYARLVHNHIPLCHDVISFNLRVAEYPVLEMKRDYILCDNEKHVRLYADPGFNSYKWSTGATTSTITVSESGNYWVKVGNNYDGLICETTADITVSISGPPETWSVETNDWTDNNNTVTVHTTGTGDYEYSLDESHYQDTPVFTNLDTGVYTVYIRDKNGCGSVSEKIVLLNYPKFFTPNGDGINETWRLEYSWFEPEALIYIYDRYGKLIYSFTPLTSGWDGSFNGMSLPATDYWFVVIRKSGKIHKGHFSMIR